MTFYDGDGSVLDVTYVPAGQNIVDYPTNKMPYKDESSLPVDETYRFIGWGTMADATSVISWTAAGLGRASANRRFYPVFREINVHDEPTSADYFDVTPEGVISVKSIYRTNNALRGKIVLPNSKDGNTVRQIGNFSGLTNISHIFVMPDNEITIINENAFRNCTGLHYIEWPLGLREIQAQAFQNAHLESIDLSDLRLLRIGAQAFENSLSTPHGTEARTNHEEYARYHIDIYLPGTLTHIGNQAFGYINDANIGSINIGSDGDFWDLSSVVFGDGFQNFAAQNTQRHDNLVYNLYVQNTTNEQVYAFLANSFRIDDDNDFSNGTPYITIIRP